MIKEDGSFYTCTEFNSIYNVNSNFLNYNGIVKSIRLWVSKLNIDSFKHKLTYPILPLNIQKLTKQQKGSKHIYNVLNNEKSQPTSKTKWVELFNINNEYWKNIYQYPFQKHISTTLQWFQTRINHRILATRRFLHKINIKDSSKCLFCKQEETLTHMLWSCPETQTIINELKRWLFNNENELNIDEKTFIFNTNQKYTWVQLYLLLETKYYIFSYKHLEKKLSIITLKHRIRKVFHVQQTIAIKNNEVEKFDTNWNPYKEQILNL